MKIIIGFTITFACIGTGYVLAHGNLLAIWQPLELVIICGSAFGAFIVANPGSVIKSVFKSLPTLLKGSAYSKAVCMDLLALMYDLFTKARKDGVMALESDVDEPDESAVFQKYPKILENHHAVDFITDYLRLMVSGNMNAMEIENLMDVELGTHHDEAGQAADSVTQVSEGLPAFGIVAAVLGVVITMQSIGGPVEEIGAHVAAALVGTFLGILMAYGFVGPMGASLKQKAEEEARFFHCIKVCFLASLNGYTPQVVVEFGRKTLFSTERPGFTELEDHVKQRK